IHELAKRGVAKQEIASRLNLDRHTVAKYLQKMEPPVVQQRPRKPSKLDRFEDYLRKRVAQGCTNGMVLFYEIKKQGYQGSYTIVKDFIRPLRQELSWSAEIRWEAPPGLYAQVDWGHFTAQLPDHSLVKLYAFVFTLVYSRVTYVEWTNRMDMATLERCHEKAFSYVGGVPKYIVYDRLKTVVLGEDKNRQVRFHPAFMDFASYYGFIPKATPANWPRGKGKVESGVKYVRRNFWQSLISISGIDDLNHRCREWLDKVANTRIHGTTGRVPFEILKEEGLQPLLGRASYPISPAVLRLVSRDSLVSYGGCRYSVPAEWAGKMVWVRAVSNNRIVVTAGGQIITEHPIEPVLKRMVINEVHYASLRGRPRLRPVRVIPRIEPPSLEVEHRSLSEYEAILEGIS
ncbi:MAG: IS21 family transposase, partial [bacterium]